MCTRINPVECIIPPHMHKNIAEKGSPEQRKKARNAITNSARLRAERAVFTEMLDLVHPVVKSEDGSIRYDPDTKPHVNLVCMQCGQIIDLPDVDLTNIEASVAEQGFHAHDYSVVVHGVCAACRGNQED